MAVICCLVPCKKELKLEAFINIKTDKINCFSGYNQMNRSRNITMVYFEWEKGIGYDEKQDQKRRYFLDTPRPYL